MGRKIILVPSIRDEQLLEKLTREIREEIKKRRIKIRQILHSEKTPAYPTARLIPTIPEKRKKMEIRESEEISLFSIMHCLPKEVRKEIEETQDLNQFLFSSNFSNLREDIKASLRKNFKKILKENRKNLLLIINSPLFELLVETLWARYLPREVQNIILIFSLNNQDEFKKMEEIDL